MNEVSGITIRSEAEFLANVIALKSESEERLQVMADCLHEHNNLHASGVFQELASIITSTIQQLEQKAAGLTLPVIPPWEYQWHCPNDPEALCMDHAHYMMSTREALQLALFNEQRSIDFFTRVHDEVELAAVRELALQQIEIEKEYAAIIRQRLAGVESEGDDFSCEDLDPPNMPE
jgi:hypothetical protein